MKQQTNKVNRRICDWHDRGDFTVYKVAKRNISRYLKYKQYYFTLFIGGEKIRVKLDIAEQSYKEMIERTNPTWLLKKSSS